MVGGNTDMLLDETLEGASSQGPEVEKVVLNALKFIPCQECEELREDENCII